MLLFTRVLLDALTRLHPVVVDWAGAICFDWLSRGDVTVATELYLKFFR